VRTELQDRLRLAESDLLKNFFFILQRTHWYDSADFRKTECVSQGDLDGMTRLELPVESGDLARDASLTLMNSYLDGMGRVLHYGNTESKKTYFNNMLDSAVDADDPAQVLFTTAQGKAAVVEALSTASVSVFGCYSTSVDQPPVVRTALGVAQDGQSRFAFSVEVAKFKSNSKVGELRAVSISVTPMKTGDADGATLITRVRSGKPSDRCASVLQKYFADFPSPPTTNN